MRVGECARENSGAKKGKGNHDRNGEAKVEKDDAEKHILTLNREGFMLWVNKAKISRRQPA